MYTVLLDSSNVNLSVGLAKEGILLKETSYEAWQTQSEHMIPEINALLEKHNVDKNDFVGIIVNSDFVDAFTFPDDGVPQVPE